VRPPSRRRCSPSRTAAGRGGWWLDTVTCCRPAAQDYVINGDRRDPRSSPTSRTRSPTCCRPRITSGAAAADPRYSSDEQRAHAMEVKVNRQRIVIGRTAPSLDIVMTEGALRQTVGPPRVSGSSLAGSRRWPTLGFAGDCRRRRPRGGALAGLAPRLAVRGRRARGWRLRPDDAAQVRGRHRRSGSSTWPRCPAGSASRVGGDRTLPQDLRRASLGGASRVPLGAADPRRARSYDAHPSVPHLASDEVPDQSP